MANRRPSYKLKHTPDLKQPGKVACGLVEQDIFDWLKTLEDPTSYHVRQALKLYKAIKNEEKYVEDGWTFEPYEMRMVSYDELHPTQLELNLETEGLGPK